MRKHILKHETRFYLFFKLLTVLLICYANNCVSKEKN